MRLFISVFFLVSFCNLNVFSQTVQENSGWLFMLNSTKLNDKWSTHLDIQLRSADRWDGVKNFLFRPGLSYHISKNSNVTLGYLLANTFIKETGAPNNNLTEHRIWEQYILLHKIKTVNVQHRFRLEQRFIEKSQEDIFAQRLRYFFRILLPVDNNQETFTKGPFVALQNELFFNIQNKNLLNNSVFDQNRAYAAVGYRFFKSLDLEAGYLNQAIKAPVGNTANNVIQLAIYTRF